MAGTGICTPAIPVVADVGDVGVGAGKAELGVYIVPVVVVTADVGVWTAPVVVVMVVSRPLRFK